MWAEQLEKDRPKLIMLSACEAGHKDMIEAFADGGKGCRYCIAPVFPADFERAALFSALFALACEACWMTNNGSKKA